MLVVGSLPCSERFSSGYSSFPLKTNIPNSNSTKNQVDEELLCGCPTSKSLFIYFEYFSLRTIRLGHFLGISFALYNSCYMATLILEVAEYKIEDEYEFAN